jgi:hypothetical protein
VLLDWNLRELIDWPLPSWDDILARIARCPQHLERGVMITAADLVDLVESLLAELRDRYPGQSDSSFATVIESDCRAHFPDATPQQISFALAVARSRRAEADDNDDDDP